MSEQNTQPAWSAPRWESSLHAGDARNYAKQAWRSDAEMNFH